tara:strand:+ start:182 stop:517 length:336 start_codon:yes stop_codon:yes gene_type:complete
MTCKNCCKKKVNFKIYIPSGCELGVVDVYGVDDKEEIVSQYIPNRVRGDWNSDEEDEEEDPDYVPSDGSDVEAIYENSHLSKEDIAELEEELADILREQDNQEIEVSDEED